MSTQPTMISIIATDRLDNDEQPANICPKRFIRNRDDQFVHHSRRAVCPPPQSFIHIERQQRATTIIQHKQKETNSWGWIKISYSCPPSDPNPSPNWSLSCVSRLTAIYLIPELQFVISRNMETGAKDITHWVTQDSGTQSNNISQLQRNQNWKQEREYNYMFE